MIRKKRWTYSEQQILMDNYAKCTGIELQKLLPGRSERSIHVKICWLKEKGLIKGNRTKATIKRAYKQRDKKRAKNS